MKSNILSTIALLALPAFCAAHGPAAERDPQTDAAFAQAKAKVPAPRWDKLREQRHTTPSAVVSVVKLDKALAQSVVVVIDAQGKPQAECIDSAPADSPR